MSIYVFENPSNNASIIYDETTLSEQQKERGIAIEELPVKDIVEGKIAILKCRKSTEEVWYEYEDILPSQEEIENKKIANLEQQLLELQEYIINKEAEELLNQGGM